MNVAEIIGRENTLFEDDLRLHGETIGHAIKGARVLLFGGAGSIGKEICAQIFRRAPAALHVIDVSENNLVELVRELRSSIGYAAGETRFLPLDMGGLETSAFLDAQEPYDYVLNLAAMKHVRSEKDAYSLMRMIKVNVLDALRTLEIARARSAKKYFAVSTDKASNPAGLMGASKRIMEDVLFSDCDGDTQISTARFANVAFSDGSLLHGFRQRFLLQQPLSAPRDVRRYFITGTESGLLCLASLILGRTREIFFPKFDTDRQLLSFSDIAVRFLESQGYQAVALDSEDEARGSVKALIAQRKWPCYFFDSDTAGEKLFEEFYTSDDNVDWARFRDIAVINAPALGTEARVRLARFLQTIERLRSAQQWDKRSLVAAVREACPDLSHIDADRFLDDKM